MPRVSSYASAPRASPNRANQGSTESARSPPSMSERDGTLKDGRTPKKARPIGGRDAGQRDAEQAQGGCERQHQLDREGDATDRRVERGGDALVGARGDQQGPLPHGHGDQLPKRRAERGADLDDRPLASDRAATAERRVDIGVVVEGPLAEEQKVMESADHGAEDISTEAGDHAHRQGAKDHHPPCGCLRFWRPALRLLHLFRLLCLLHAGDFEGLHGSAVLRSGACRRH